jgi:hypothetical protein
MSKYTAGPWWIDDGDETGAIFIASGSGDNYRTLAEVINSDADVDAEANARLIAAAPELLEALELCRNRLNFWTSDIETCDLSSSDVLTLEQANSAIAKAKGDQKCLN